MALANKSAKQKEENNLKKLNDYVFDQEIGYIVSEILNSKLRVASNDGIILSYEYDSVVEQNLNNIMKLEQVFECKVEG